MKDKIVTLDVREDIRNGREPLGKIMQAVGRLKADEKLLLFAPFEPVPLFQILAQQGFSHESKAIQSGDWQVLFERKTNGPAPAQASATPRQAPCKAKALKVFEVDARGLEPPQPLVRILEHLTTLPKGAELRARTDRKPIHLYAHIEERGFIGETEKQTDGSFVTRIRWR